MIDDPWAARPPRRRSSWVLAVILLASVGVAAWAVQTGAITPSGVLPTTNATPPRPTDRPLPGLEAAPAPLGTPPPVASPSDAYRFVSLQDDGVRPVAYDPCRPVHVVVRPQGEPAGGREVLTEAFARLSAVTGLQFVQDGETDEAPASDRPVYQPDRYGDRWAPVLVAWVTPEENPDLAGWTAGQAGSTRVGVVGGDEVLVTGTVQLDAEQLGKELAPDGDAVAARAIVLHELAHLVGLDHVSDPTQIMYPSQQDAVPDYAAGDLTGLAALGRGACVPEL